MQKTSLEQMCATKGSTVEGQRKALRIARNLDTQVAGEAGFSAVFGCWLGVCVCSMQTDMPTYHQKILLCPKL